MYSYCCGMMIEQAIDWDQVRRWWNALVQWIKDNWVEIAKVLVSLIIVVLEPSKDGRFDLGPLHIEW